MGGGGGAADWLVCSVPPGPAGSAQPAQRQRRCRNTGRPGLLSGAASHPTLAPCAPQRARRDGADGGQKLPARPRGEIQLVWVGGWFEFICVLTSQPLGRQAGRPGSPIWCERLVGRSGATPHHRVQPGRSRAAAGSCAAWAGCPMRSRAAACLEASRLRRALCAVRPLAPIPAANEARASWPPSADYPTPPIHPAPTPRPVAD